MPLLKNTDADAVALMSEGFGDHMRYKSSANAVAKTWKTTFDRLFRRDTEAVDLLAFILH